MVEQSVAVLAVGIWLVLAGILEMGRSARPGALTLGFGVFWLLFGGILWLVAHVSVTIQ